MTGAQVAAAARRLVGVRFRLHGRDAGTGLDCIGVAALAMPAAQAAVPTGYPLRGGCADTISRRLDALFARGDGTREGDLLLVVPGPAQFHLAIRTQCGVVHADAGLRRVVERPGPPPWPVIGAWRVTEEG